MTLGLDFLAFCFGFKAPKGFAKYFFYSLITTVIAVATTIVPHIMLSMFFTSDEYLGYPLVAVWRVIWVAILLSSGYILIAPFRTINPRWFWCLVWAAVALAAWFVAHIYLNGLVLHFGSEKLFRAINISFFASWFLSIVIALVPIALRFVKISNITYKTSPKQLGKSVEHGKVPDPRRDWRCTLGLAIGLWTVYAFVAGVLIHTRVRELSGLEVQITKLDDVLIAKLRAANALAQQEEQQISELENKIAELHKLAHDTYNTIPTGTVIRVEGVGQGCRGVNCKVEELNKEADLTAEKLAAVKRQIISEYATNGFLTQYSARLGNREFDKAVGERLHAMKDRDEIRESHQLFYAIKDNVIVKAVSFLLVFPGLLVLIVSPFVLMDAHRRYARARQQG